METSQRPGKRCHAAVALPVALQRGNREKSVVIDFAMPAVQRGKLGEFVQMELM